MAFFGLLDSVHLYKGMIVSFYVEERILFYGREPGATDGIQKLGGSQKCHFFVNLQFSHILL